MAVREIQLYANFEHSVNEKSKKIVTQPNKTLEIVTFIVFKRETVSKLCMLFSLDYANCSWFALRFNYVDYTTRKQWRHFNQFYIESYYF